MITAAQLAKILGVQIAQGRGDFEVCVHQWNVGMEPVTAIHLRDGCQAVELYTNTTECVPETGHDDVDDLI